MSDLTSAYRRLARSWTHEELADLYGRATRGGDRAPQREPDLQIRRPVAMLASAVPPCATLSVAIHVIHVLPERGDGALVDRLLEHAETSSAVTLRRCHQGLELDGRAHEYTADERLPAIYDIAAALLEAARPDREPRALVDPDRAAPDAAAAIVDGLGRVLTLHTSAGTARTLGDEP